MTQDELKSILTYDPASGIFTWVRDKGKAKIGKVAGSQHRLGYIMIGIDRVRHYAHRLAFLYMEGSIPDLVDHIDQNPANNAWNNLRPASKALNAINSKRRSTNRSGATGVSWHRIGGKWQAHCGRRYLGLFSTKELAREAYLAASREIAS